MSGIDISDGISDELNTKVKIKVKWLIIGSFLLTTIGGNIGYRYFYKKNFTENQRHAIELQEKYNITRKFQNNRTSYAWGTFWNHCGAWLSADHVDYEFNRVTPDFVDGKPWKPDGKIDAVVWADKWECDYREPEDGENIYLMGYPQRSEHPVIANGKVLFNRGYSASEGYETSTWIVVFETGVEPVSTGMSGGIVVDKDMKPIGITVTTGGDLDGDWSADIVAMSDVKRLWTENK